MRQLNPRIHAIQAAVLRKRGGPLEIETLELEGPEDDEVLVQIVASGICHTDIDMIDEWNDKNKPVVLGHEGAGIVVEVGNKIKHVKIGDHVLLSYQSCGRCQPCRDGHASACERFYPLNFGFKRMDGSNALHRSGVRGHFFGQSSFATHVLATERNLVKVPPDLPLDLFAPMGCGMQTGAGTVMNSLAVNAGESIAIFGTGAVGMAAIMAARIVEATPIIGVDIIPARLDLALELGATHVIDATVNDVISSITGITGRGVDHVIDTTANPRMQQLAIDALNPHGTVGLLTGEQGTHDLHQGHKTIGIIQGDAVPQEFIPRLIALNKEGKFPLERLEKFYDFRDINEAIADAKHGETIKPVLRISEV